MSKTENKNISNALINQYKKDKSIVASQHENSKWTLLKSSVEESFDVMKRFLPVFLSIFGLIMAIPPVTAHYFVIVMTSLGIVVGAEILFIFISYIRFSRKVYKKKFKELIFEIKIEDYIVNMMDLLLEYKDQKNTKLMFAIGMNETGLERIAEGDKTINKDCFVSLCHDFMDFTEYCGINIIAHLQEVMKQKGMVPEKGSVFTTDFEIKNANAHYTALNGCSFTVLFYVNSSSKDGLFGRDHESIEDGRETVSHLMDATSDYIYREGKGRTMEFVLMIPAIGTGKTGKAPYRNILIEIINGLSISGYCIPNKVVLSLRDYELFSSKYEASSLLRLAKKILVYRK